MKLLRLLIFVALMLATPVLADDPRDVLNQQQRVRVEQSIDRALVWLADKQLEDGSFPTMSTGQPAVTALSVLAFVSRGHVPGEGKYGQTITRGLEYVLQKQRNDGSFGLGRPEEEHGDKQFSHTAVYNQAISSLVLSECYGMATPELSAKMRPAIERSIAFAMELQMRQKAAAADRGGWRYMRVPRGEQDSDLLVTSWQLLFLRSAKNAEFDVPVERINQAVQFINRCFEPSARTFQYFANAPHERPPNRAIAGAGILSLSLAGQHNSKAAQSAADYIVARPFGSYDMHPSDPLGERFFYSVFYATQGLYQLGGAHWQQFYPETVRQVLNCQHSDGSWPAESNADSVFGKAYTSSLAILTLTTPQHVLPIFQR